MESKAYWVGFTLVKGIGAVRFRALLDFFGNLEIAWNAPGEALRSAGLSEKIVENLIKTRRGDDLESTWKKIEKLKIQVLTWDEEAYPRLLKEINQPPPVLYVLGSIKVEDDWAVAVVGTRRVTGYGRQVTEEIGSFLAQNGITVISGLARGVDEIAHQSALRMKGRTLAVLGSGVDIIYPPEHRHLAEQIIANGALISDYPPGTQPEGSNFPPRNRIISGLGRATVVVEAGDQSGALITATFAADQGRDVFAVPGNIYSPLSKGTNRLIAQGAQPLLKPQDILETLQLVRVQQKATARRLLPSDGNEASLLSVIGAEPLNMDEIGAQSGLPIEKVSATLTMMELKGMVRNVGGTSYVLAHESMGEYEVDRYD